MGSCTKMSIEQKSCSRQSSIRDPQTCVQSDVGSTGFFDTSMFPVHNLRAMAPVNDSKILGNDTIDVMLKGCFFNYNTVACIRNGVMCFVLLLTMIWCLVRICQLHHNQHPTRHHYFVFYVAVVEAVLLLIHWLAEGYVQLDFTAEYLKLLQFLVVSHFYWKLATRAIRKESLTNRVIVPVYVAALLFFTVVVILGCVKVQVSWIECQQPYWLLLSSAEFVLVQLFVVAGFYITRRINQIIGFDCERTKQKCHLWSIIVAFEVSAMAGVIYDGSLLALVDEEKGCSGVFNHAQEIYSPVFGTFMMFKFVLPIWAMLAVFHPIKRVHLSASMLPPPTHAGGSFRSTFIPSDLDRYQPLHNPAGDIQGVQHYQSASSSYPPPANGSDNDWFPDSGPVHWSPATYPERSSTLHRGLGVHQPRLAGFSPGAEAASSSLSAVSPRSPRRSSSCTTNLATICEDSDEAASADDKRPILS